MFERSHGSTRPAVEPLENRTLLAATVVADVAVGGFALLVTGTSSGENIQVNKRSDGKYEVKFNGSVQLDNVDPTNLNRIVVFGNDGNDDITVASDITIPAYLYGNAGNDRLRGGSGADVVVGGAGDDLPVGHNGRDLLVGGAGSDRLVGNAEDDILVAGFTAYDDEGDQFTNQINFVDIMREWNRNGGNTMPGMTAQEDYAERVFHIITPGGGGGNNAFAYLSSDDPVYTSTVYDDGVSDMLTGSSGYDLFFFNSDGPQNGSTDPNGDPTVTDKVTDLAAAEFAQDIDFINQ
jgi:Ca2+-binding RTX toxin-like protein